MICKYATYSDTCEGDEHVISFSDVYKIDRGNHMYIAYYIEDQLVGLAALDKSRCDGLDIREWFDVDGDIVRVSRELSRHESIKLVDDDIVYAIDRKEKMTDLD